MIGLHGYELIPESVALTSNFSVHSLLTVLHAPCVDNFG